MTLSRKIGLLSVALLAFAATAPGARAAADRAAPTKQALRVVLVDTGLPPFYFAPGAKEKGIYVEILEAAATHTGDRYEYVHVPQNRKYLLFEQGKVDIEPGVDPSIRQRWKDISVYTTAFMSVDDILVFRKTSGSVSRTTEPLPGQRIGGILGYSYPWFDEAFRNKELIRDDSPNELTILRKLHMGRIDVGIMYRPIFEYWRKEIDSLDVQAGIAIDSRPMMFRFHRQHSAAVQRMNKAIKLLLDDGTIEKILMKYK